MEKKSVSTKRFGVRGEHLVVIQIAIAALFVFIPVWPDLRNLEFYQQLVLIRWCALVTGMLIGAAFGIGGSIGIRKYLTPLPYPVADNRLVITGVYSQVRHPLYSAQLFAAAGYTMFTLSLSHLLVTAIALAFFNHKASIEEAWLTERHPEYREYAARAGKFVPMFGRLKK